MEDRQLPIGCELNRIETSSLDRILLLGRRRQPDDADGGDITFEERVDGLSGAEHDQLDVGGLDFGLGECRSECLHDAGRHAFRCMMRCRRGCLR